MQETVTWVMLISLVAILGMAAVSDFRTLTIPNPLTVGLALLFPIAALLKPGHVPWLSHLAAGAVVLLLGAVLFRFRILGGGDVKLLAAAALWTGLESLAVQLLYVSVIGLALTVLLVLARQVIVPSVYHLRPFSMGRLPKALLGGEGIPYGIAIAVGTLIVALP